MIGIIIAMKTEAPNLIKNNFNDSFIHSVKKHKFHVIKTLSGSLAVIGYAGIGKVNAAAVTTLMINTFNITACFNIGSCGIVHGLEVNQPLVVEQTTYCDVDVTAFGYEQNQVPQMPSIYHTDLKLNEIITNILKSSNLAYLPGICNTSDSFVNTGNISNFKLLKTPHGLVCDMECAAIAQTCHIFNIPFCAIKIGVDKLHQHETNEVQFKKNLEMVANQVELIAANCIQALSFAFGKDDTKDETNNEQLVA